MSDSEGKIDEFDVNKMAIETKNFNFNKGKRGKKSPFKHKHSILWIIQNLDNPLIKSLA